MKDINNFLLSALQIIDFFFFLKIERGNSSSLNSLHFKAFSLVLLFVLSFKNLNMKPIKTSTVSPTKTTQILYTFNSLSSTSKQAKSLNIGYPTGEVFPSGVSRTNRKHQFHSFSSICGSANRQLHFWISFDCLNDYLLSQKTC